MVVSGFCRSALVAGARRINIRLLDFSEEG
jgi:hypothetical protein